MQSSPDRGLLVLWWCGNPSLGKMWLVGGPSVCKVWWAAFFMSRRSLREGVVGNTLEIGWLPGASEYP